MTCSVLISLGIKVRSETGIHKFPQPGSPEKIGSMIDIHCHILPAIDDGAKSWEISEKMCSMAVADGITHLVATPHANSSYEYNREVFSGMLTELREKTDGKLKFSLGCDFNLSYENLEELFVDPQKFVIEGTQYLLIELSEYAIPPHFTDLLFRMGAELQIIPILTHPERNPILQAHPEYVLQWLDSCLVQVTANSLTGKWGKRAKEVAIWLLRQRAVHVIASDAHDPIHRPPVLSAGAKVASEIVGPDAAFDLVQTNPEAIVQGREISSLHPSGISG